MRLLHALTFGGLLHGSPNGRCATASPPLRQASDAPLVVFRKLDVARLVVALAWWSSHALLLRLLIHTGIVSSAFRGRSGAHLNSIKKVLDGLLVNCYYKSSYQFEGAG